MMLEDEIERRDLSNQYVTEFEDLMRRVESGVEAAAVSYDLAVILGETRQFFREGEEEVDKPGNLPSGKTAVYGTPYEADHQEVIKSFQDIREKREDPADPDKLVPEIAEELEMNPEVSAYAHEYLDKAIRNDKTFLNGIEEGMAGGAIYLAGKLRDKKVTRVEVAETLDISPNTVRNYYEYILDAYS